MIQLVLYPSFLPAYTLLAFVPRLCHSSMCICLHNFNVYVPERESLGTKVTAYCKYPEELSNVCGLEAISSHLS